MKRRFGKILCGLLAGVLTLGLMCATPVAAYAATVVTAANTQKHESNLPISPAVITKMEKEEDIDAYSVAAYKPSTLILDVDDELNVLSSEGKKVSTLDTVYRTFKRSIVLVINVSTTDAGDAFSDFVEKKSIEDISVMSKDPSLVAYVKEKQPRIRAVVDYSEKNIGDSIYDEIAEAHKVGANVIVLSQEQSDYETVFYAQGMLTTVWTILKEMTEFNIVSCISTGAYGIIAQDYALCYATYEKYESGSLSRSFYNIAHRTLPYDYPENSYEGMVAAVESGATHVEIDIKVTSDKQLVVMHENDLSKTTNGTGNIESMTLEQLRQFKITKTMADVEVEGVEIPTLAEMFGYLKSHDFVLVVEIKTENTLCCGLLKDLMDEYQVYDKVVVITYSWNQMKIMRQILPQVPLASLNAFAYAEFQKGILGDVAEVNAVPDCSFDYSTNANRNYKSRGYMAYAYTYDTKVSAVGAAANGCVGITNNRADQVGDYAKRIYTKSVSIQENETIADKFFSVTLEKYNGKTETVSAKVAFFEETENDYNVILSYNCGDYILYTEKVAVTKISQSSGNEGTVDSSGSNTVDDNHGCGSILDVNTGCLLMVAALCGTLMLMKKSKKLR